VETFGHLTGASIALLADIPGHVAPFTNVAAAWLQLPVTKDISGIDPILGSQITDQLLGSFFLLGGGHLAVIGPGDHNPDRVLIVSESVVGDAVDGGPLFYRAITGDVEVIPGGESALGVHLSAIGKESVSIGIDIPVDNDA
jgi:hypothetical protein